MTDWRRALLERDLVGHVDRRSAEFGHDEAQFDVAAGIEVVLQCGRPRLGGPAHGCMRSAWVERLRLGVEPAILMEEEHRLCAADGQREVVVEHAVGRDVRPARGV